MLKNLRWRIPIIIAALIVSLIGLWPPLAIKDKDGKVIQEGKINLGLDLQGGMHLVLKVDTSKLTPKEAEGAPERALEIIRNRIDQLGVKEVSIARQGKDEIVVQLPGITERERAIELVGQTALLEFRLVSSDTEKIKQAMEGVAPEGYELTENEDGERILIEKKADVTGADLVNAIVRFNQSAFNQPYVAINFNKEGAAKFARLTGENIGQRLAIVLDGKVKSAPVIREKIPGGEGMIQGRFSPQEANDLAIVLKAGALPAPVVIEEERTIGPLLGQDSINAGMKAVAIGAILVLLFMLIYYRLAGLIANIALFLNFIIILGFMGFFGFTLTLPGIAGLILTLGMAVDANVLIYERIREELKAGKSLRNAIDLGYSKALSAIIDSNLTTVAAAALLLIFGTGPIRGFAVTLISGLVASMFTAVFVTHVIFDIMSLSPNFKTLKMAEWIKLTKIDFIGKRKICYTLSIVLIIAGITAFFVRGNKNFGVDFTGGTLQEFKFEREVDLAAMRKALTDTGIKNASIQGLAGNKDVLIRTPEDVYPQINSKLKETFADNKFELMRVEKVGPSVGKLLKQKAAGALFWGLVIILIYVAWRFKHWEYGLAGIIALFHDVFVAVGAMALAGMEFDLNTVAAVLTIVGFSINDTVVIYDRIRENMRLLRKTTFTELINLSVNQTLSRTIFTTFTAQLTVVSLLFWGGEVLKGFSFCLFVGFLSGVYSTVFIASPLLIVWQRKKK